MISLPLPWLRRWRPPPLLHISHAKAGSTWVAKILGALYGSEVARGGAPARFDFHQQRVYSLFMSHEGFLAHPELLGVHRFVIIRDLRDTLVSDYFSLRDTHKLDGAGGIQGFRDVLQARDVEGGLDYLIAHRAERHAAIQRSWVGKETILLRYEEMLRDDVAIFSRLLLDTFGHALSEARLRRVVVANRFENVFHRPLGQADPTSHGRQGAPGDWRRHFTPANRAAFHQRFGDLLLATGYETDDSWVTAAPEAKAVV